MNNFKSYVMDRLGFSLGSICLVDISFLQRPRPMKRRIPPVLFQLSRQVFTYLQHSSMCKYVLFLLDIIFHIKHSLSLPESRNCAHIMSWRLSKFCCISSNYNTFEIKLLNVPHGRRLLIHCPLTHSIPLASSRLSTH